MSYGIPDIYSFFNEFKKYKQYDNYIETHYGKDKHNENTCGAFITDVKISSTETANEICAKFKNLYKFIIFTKSNLTNKSLDNDDFAYLNYWINSKLKDNTLKHNVTVSEFHRNMNNREEEFTTHDIFENKLFDLEENDFQNMELLSNLENQYSEIYQNVINYKEKEKISCIEYYNEFIDKYKDGISRCHNNTNFCNALNIYKTKYYTVYIPETISEKCIEMEIPELPTYNYASLGNKEITLVGSALGPSAATLFTLLFLYKFTPFRQWIHSKIGKNKGAYTIAYEENDQSLLNTLDNEIINFDRNPYNISYDSVGNL
ncbi:PIR Superfamily Protein [Plasmodium ovale curtisi]|uniref:PIR Superfamily Protein n=1 Tax=Plasmodium ovale curtisi TaxID=864141 RepID=A0A1A8X525_PLAOA|nr:PIR Superfamily Protein [Plasmodium ovale curtisi]